MSTEITQAVSYIIGGGVVGLVGSIIVVLARAIIVNPVNSNLKVAVDKLQANIDVLSQRLTDSMTYVNNCLAIQREETKERSVDFYDRTNSSSSEIKVLISRVAKIDQEILEVKHCYNRIKENCKGSCRR